jgi:superkiller protein 3
LLKLIELDPNFGFAYDNLAMAYVKTGRGAEAVATFEKAAELTNRYSLVLGHLGYGFAVTGKRDQALAIIQEIEEKYSRKQAH